jgi:uncharacterized Zn-binding protein involved in type VI secretion
MHPDPHPIRYNRLTGVPAMKLRYLAPLALAATALAQQSAAPKPATIEGKVVNSMTNEPLRKVDLTLATDIENDYVETAMAMFGAGDDAPAPPPPKVEKKSYTVTTDASGKFHFDRVDPGDYYLSGKHAGFMDEQYKPGSHQGFEGKLRLAAGDVLTGVVLRLTPQGAISGRVQDEDGDPVPNAIVTAMSYSYESGHRKLQPADTSTTNDRGEYRLGKLPPGHYYISASYMRMDPLGTLPPPPQDGSPETGYVCTYYPRTADVALAVKIDVSAAADLTGFTIQLQKSKVVRVKGQAVMADGTPMKGGQVMLMSSANAASMQMGMLNPQGHFELGNIQPGSYTIMTVQMSGSKPSITMQPLVVPNEGLPNVKLGNQTERAIQGRIVAAGDGKVEVKDLTVMLEGDETMSGMPVIGRTTESGAFTLKAAPAPYRLVLSLVPPGTYLKSVTLNGRETLGKLLDLSAGAGAGDVEVTLGTDGGQVDATVSLSDKPLFDATVVLIPADPSRRFLETTKSESTDETGHAIVKDVPPGDYLVLAWEKVESGEWFDPDILKAVEKQAAHVTVGSKSTGKVELKAIPRA